MARHPLPLYAGLVAAAIVAIVAFRSAAIGLLAASGPAAPFAFVRESEAGSDAILQRLATSTITPASAPAIVARAEQVAEQHPLSINAPFAIGMARAALNERAAANAAMLLTTRRNPRNRVVRTWLTDQALRNGDYATALKQLNALMRIEPTLATQISTAMVPFLFAPGMVDAFADVAVDRPSWLPAFIDSARRDARLSGEVHRLMLLIAQRQPRAVEPRNVTEVVTELQRRGDYARALQLLRAFYPTAYSDGNMVFDPQFIGIDGSPPFSWTIDRDNAGASIGTADGLQVMGPVRADTRILGQSLVLSPGTYRLRARAAGSGVSGYRWQIVCSGVGGRILDAGLSEVDRLSRIDGGQPFTVPADCSVPQIALVKDGSANGSVAVPSLGIFAE